jgi:hypothetical protein
MGGGNGQKSKMARERNIEKQKAAKSNFIFLFTLYNFPKVCFFSDYNLIFVCIGSQLEYNKKAMTIQVVSLQAFAFKFCYHIYAIAFLVCVSFSFFYGIISCQYIFSELYDLIAI